MSPTKRSTKAKRPAPRAKRDPRPATRRAAKPAAAAPDDAGDEADAAADPAADANPDADDRLARLPSVRKIADALRNRPAWAVLADICRSLGMTPEHELWYELTFVMVENGGDPTTLFKDTFRRLEIPIGDPMSYVPPGWTPSPRPSPAPAATGPP